MSDPETYGDHLTELLQKAEAECDRLREARDAALFKVGSWKLVAEGREEQRDRYRAALERQAAGNYHDDECISPDGCSCAERFATAALDSTEAPHG